MKKRVWVLLVFLPFLTKAQEKISWAKPKAILPFNQSDLISLDARDQIFVSNQTGDILLFDQKGNQLNLFSPPRQGKLQQLEASWTVNIFSFSTDLQEYRILDRFLNPLSENSLLQTEISLAKAATLGNNNIIWMWDESDLSLKSLNYLQQQIIQSQPLNLILDSPSLNVREIREVKNRLYLNIPDSGIFIFDNQGNFIQKLTILVDQKLAFYKERIYWLEEDLLKSISLRTLEVSEHGEVPLTKAKSIQIGQEILVFQTSSELQIFDLPEELKNLK
jgi:hypothetical protein